MAADINNTASQGAIASLGGGGQWEVGTSMANRWDGGGIKKE